ncbi:A24 family peptidase [Xylophilus sp. GW821-FHT01B05]
MQIAARACLLLLLLAVLVCDWRERRVPNRLLLAGVIAGAIALVPGVQPLGIGHWQALAGMAIGFCVLLPFYPLGWMGAGDVKFAGVLGLWFGVQALLPIWCLASVLAAVHALAWLVLQRYPLPPVLYQALAGPPGPAAMPAGDDTPPAGPRRRCIPYASYLAMAALVVLAVR